MPQENELAETVKFSDVELAVIEAVCKGLSNEAAADELFVSPHTVRFHLVSIFKKLGVHNRLQMMRALPNHLPLERVTELMEGPRLI